MKLTMLGTGNALVTEYYNTCFVISDKNQHFMVDGGGGNRYNLLKLLIYSELMIKEFIGSFGINSSLFIITN